MLKTALKFLGCCFKGVKRQVIDTLQSTFQHKELADINKVRILQSH